VQMKMMTQSHRKRQQDNRVPLEIDTHYQLYGKHAWEIEYGDRCPNCNKRIDEFGFCACGSAH
jgi:rRNA maturation endonuclease Nob1